jgi:hypothetical protein
MTLLFDKPLMEHRRHINSTRRTGSCLVFLHLLPAGLIEGDNQTHILLNGDITPRITTSNSSRNRSPGDERDKTVRFRPIPAACFWWLGNLRGSWHSMS